MVTNHRVLTAAMPSLTALLCVQQALSRCLVAATQQQQQGGADEEGALGLVQRLMFNLTKKGMTAASLAVRQVSLHCAVSKGKRNSL